MLEERLSNTYNQHSIGGYNLPLQRPASSIYPSISSNAPAAPGAAESFYTNSQSEQYSRPQSTFYAPPQNQNQEYNRRASITNPGYPSMDQRRDSYNTYSAQPPPPQRTASWQTNDPSSAPTPANPAHAVPNQRNDNHNQYPPQTHPAQPQRSGSWQAPDAPQPPNIPAENAPQQQAPAPVTAQPQPATNYTPSEPALTDPNAAFYYNNSAQAPQPQHISEQNQSQYPLTQSPPQEYRPPVQQQAPHSQFSNTPVKQQSQQAASQPQQAPYWQAQQQNPAAQQNWPAPGPTYNNYTQDSFPSAPNHTPQQKVVEESLIDL